MLTISFPGRVHIVTGGYTGCGLELVKSLYQHNATVFVAGRSEDKGSKAIAALKEQFPSSKGRLEFLHLDLADQSTIKASAEAFMSKESRLDTLTNNAGVMNPPAGSVDAHGHEQQIGTNCIGPWLFTQCLLPMLQKTAHSSPPGSVRVTWAASLAAYLGPKPGGIQFDDNGAPKLLGPGTDYAQSKAGNVYLASEFARRYGKDGIISLSWNPGNLKSELQRHMGKVSATILDLLLLYPAKFGGYTELYASCSEEITQSQNGAFIKPWGKIGELRKDVLLGTKSKEEGGSGAAEKFWAYCEKEAGKYL
jgi:retinol dehydrogenase 12